MFSSEILSDNQTDISAFARTSSPIERPQLLEISELLLIRSSKTVLMKNHGSVSNRSTSWRSEIISKRKKLKFSDGQKTVNHQFKGLTTALSEKEPTSEEPYQKPTLDTVSMPE